MSEAPSRWRGCEWTRPRDGIKARAWMAVASMVAIVVIMVVLAGCVQMQEHADKARAFWCDPAIGRVPTYAALVRTLKPEVSPQVRQAVAAAEAACASPEMPLDVLVAKAVLAGLAVDDGDQAK